MVSTAIILKKEPKLQETRSVLNIIHLF